MYFISLLPLTTIVSTVRGVRRGLESGSTRDGRHIRGDRRPRYARAVHGPRIDTDRIGGAVGCVQRSSSRVEAQYVRDQNGDEHMPDTEDDQPLLVDAMTAQVLVAVHDAVLEGNEEKAAKMRCLIRKDRLNFGNIVEKCWSCVR